MPNKSVQGDHNEGLKIIYLFIFVLFLVSYACNTTSSEDKVDYSTGEVIISLEDGVLEADIKPRIEELELEWKEYFENLGSALIGVPIGEEELWVEKLKEEPMIRNAQLNREVEQRGSNLKITPALSCASTGDADVYVSGSKKTEYLL